MSQTKAQLIDNLVSPITGALGSASAPTFSFTADPNTGIYSPGADQLAVTTGGTGRLFIDSSGRLLAGTSTARSNFFGTTLSSITQIEGTGGAAGRGALSVINNDVSNNPPYVLLGRSGAATLGSNAVVVSGSRLGTLTFHGADGTSFIEAATVAGEVDGTPGTNDMPGRLVLSTTSDGASSPTERLRIDSSGRVGVGTSSPAQTLDVSGTVNFKPAAGYNSLFQQSGTALRINYLNDAGSANVSAAYRATSFEWQKSDGASVVNIDSSGRVGIGTSTFGDNVLLSLKANSATTTPGVLLEDSGTSGRKYGIYSGGGTFSFRDFTAGENRLVIDSSGRCGIGTTSPSAQLHVQSSSGSGVLKVGDSTNTYIARLQANAGDGSVNLFNEANYALTFGTNNTERARIDASGRLLVGTSTALGGERLNVVRTDATGLVLNLYNSASTSTTKIANPLLRISSNASGADTSINFTDNVSNNYYFGGNNGGAYVMSNSAGVRLSNGGTSWASDSDERLKDIIEPIKNGLDKVATLRTVIGKYKTDDEDRRRSFLIAQDVQAVLPEAVFDEQGTLMLAYTETIPLLVAALKESKERIETLETRLTALESA